MWLLLRTTTAETTGTSAWRIPKKTWKKQELITASETGLSLDEHSQADTSDDKRSIWSWFSEKIEHNAKEKNQRKEIKIEDNRKKKEATRAIRKDERDRRGIGRDDQKKIVLTLAIGLICIAGGIGFLFYLSKVNDSGIYKAHEEIAIRAKQQLLRHGHPRVSPQ